MAGLGTLTEALFCIIAFPTILLLKDSGVKAAVIGSILCWYFSEPLISTYRVLGFLLTIITPCLLMVSFPYFEIQYSNHIQNWQRYVPGHERLLALLGLDMDHSLTKKDVQIPSCYLEAQVCDFYVTEYVTFM